MTNISCLTTNPILDSNTTWFDLFITPTIIGVIFVSALLVLYLKSENPQYQLADKLSSVVISLLILAIITFLKFLHTDHITLNMLSGQIWTFVFSLLLLQGAEIVYMQTTGKKVTTVYKFLTYVILVPVILFIPTKLNITTFSLASCQSVASPFIIFYISTIALFLLIGLLVATVKHKHKSNFTNLILGETAIFVSTINFLLSTQAHQTEKSLPTVIFIWFIYFIYIIISSKNTDKTRNLHIKILPHEILLLFIVIFLINFLFYSHWQTVLNLTTLMIVVAFLSFSGAVRLVKKQIKTAGDLNKCKKQTEKLKTRITLLEDNSFSNFSEFISSLREVINKNETLLHKKTMNKKDISTIAKNQDILNNTIKQMQEILMITKLENNKFQHHWTDFNLQEIVSEVCNKFRPPALKKGLIIIFRTSLSNHPVIFSDKDQIRYILQLLLSKVIDDSKSGIIRVVLHNNHKTKKFFIDVTSSGYGLDIKTQKDILQSFYKRKIKSDSNSKIIRELYLINLIVKKIDGIFSIYSQGKNKGVRFTIDLPYEVTIKKQK